MRGSHGKHIIQIRKLEKKLINFIVNSDNNSKQKIIGLFSLPLEGLITELNQCSKEENEKFVLSGTIWHMKKFDLWGKLKEKEMLLYSLLLKRIPIFPDYTKWRLFINTNQP